MGLPAVTRRPEPNLSALQAAKAPAALDLLTGSFLHRRHLLAVLRTSPALAGLLIADAVPLLTHPRSPLSSPQALGTPLRPLQAPGFLFPLSHLPSPQGHAFVNNCLELPAMIARG